MRKTLPMHLTDKETFTGPLQIENLSQVFYVQKGLHWSPTDRNRSNRVLWIKGIQRSLIDREDL